jgi:hypothetical protein
MPDIQLRQPGSGLPDAVRDAATRAGRRRQPVDPLLLQRVRDAPGQLPGHALIQPFEISDDCLTSTQAHRETP